jgi:hypothetical protein
MISRRNLLTGLSLLPLAGGIAGCAARATGVVPAQAPAAPIPVVGPGANWNGAPLSGGAPPTDPVRTTAKPAIHWLMPSDVRLVSDLTLGVDADAHGGIKQVDFWVEGQVQTVTTPSIYTDTDANGKSRSRYGYWITLNASAFKAISTTGEARLYATAVPNDATMQRRVIGYDAVSGVDGNYPMHIFPRAVANDWSKTVRLDGSGDYTSIAAALTAAGAAAAEAPLITFAQTGFYEVTNAGSPANYANGKGFCTFAASSGVTATLGRAAAFTPGSPSSWTWTPGWDGIEFRGSGIVFDQKNWTTITQTAKPCWFNGCKFTNSIGTRDSFYWNGGQQSAGGASTPSYWDDVSLEYVSGGMQAQRYARGCQSRSTAGDIFSGTHYVCGTYVRDWNAEFFRAVLTSLSITYNSASGGSAATVSCSGGADAAGKVLTLAVTGASGNNLTLTLGQIATDTLSTIQSVADAINAWGHGWSATVQNNKGLMRASALGGESGAVSATNAYNVTANIVGAFGIHADWWQGYSGSSPRENVILRNNVCRDAVGANSALFNDDANNGGHSLDHVVKGNVWLGDYGATSVGYATMSHYVFENNSHEPWISRIQAAGADTIYCSFKNNIVGGLDHGGLDAPWINNVYMIPNGGAAINGGSNTGNTNYPNPGNNSSTNFRALFMDYTNGDVRPAASSLLLSNLKPTVNIFDALGIPFAATDVVGARSGNSPARNYPF